MSLQLTLPGFDMRAIKYLTDPEFGNLYRLILLFDRRDMPECILCQRFQRSEYMLPTVSLHFELSKYDHHLINTWKLYFQNWLRQSGRKLTYSEFRPEVVEAFMELLDTYARPVRIASKRHKSPGRNRNIVFQLELVRTPSETYVEYVIIGSEANRGQIHKKPGLSSEEHIMTVMSGVLKDHFASKTRMEAEIRAAMNELSIAYDAAKGNN